MKLPSRKIAVGFLSSILIFLIATYIGDQGGWTANQYCPNYISCVVGFFGFDAMQHFLGGAISLFIIGFYSDMYPEYSLFHENRVKNFLILLSVSIFLAFMFEVGEMSHDAWRFGIRHISQSMSGAHQLDQPMNLDTMGDMFFHSIASMIVIWFI